MFSSDFPGYYWGKNRSGTRQENYPILYKKTYTILYDIGVLGLNELDNVHFHLAGILNVFC